MRALLLFLLVPTVYSITCPPGYFLIVGQKCLKMYYSAKTHWAAETQCKADSGTLVTIKNAIDNRAVYQFAKDAMVNDIWLGISCYGNSTSECFYDDASGSPNGYSNFASLPDSSYGNCVYMMIVGASYQGKWVNINCNNLNSLSLPSLPFICETPPTMEAHPKNSCTNNYNGFCYKTSRTLGVYGPPTADGTEAQSICSAFGNLVSIHSKMEIDYIKNLYRMSGIDKIYLGAQASTIDKFNWLDGSNWDFDFMNPLNFTKGKCLVMDVSGESDGLWAQVDCDQKFDYLCKSKITGPPSLTTPKPMPTRPPTTTRRIRAKEHEILLDASNCNSTLLLAPGSISSFGYPNYSTPPSYCTWKLATLGPYRLGIYFDFWSTKGVLNIYDEFGNNIGQFYGTMNRAPFPRYSSFNIATVTFEPRPGADVDRGFHAVVLPV